LSEDSELLLTILGSFAQEEARSVSENIRWSVQKKFEKGKPMCRYAVYGYTWEGDKLVPVPEEAEIVKRIYREFLGGMKTSEIVRHLNEEGLSHRGAPFTTEFLGRLFHNEIYTGDLVLQKAYTVMHKTYKNNGELAKIVVENDHEAIITHEMQKQAEDILSMWSTKHIWISAHEPSSCFTSKIVCAKCGRYYMRSTQRNRFGDSYRWLCDRRDENGRRACSTKGIKESELRKICTLVLGIREFDEETFLKRVDHIEMDGIDKMDFFLTDGSVVHRHWCSTGRYDRWTEQARKDISDLRILKSPKLFSGILVCGECGKFMNTYKEKNRDGSPERYYICQNDKPSMLQEKSLVRMCKELTGTEDVRASVEKIVFHREGRILDFYLKDGRVITKPYLSDRKAKYGKSNSTD
jgi:site-specific DNA recombinase